jgi:helicase
LLSNATFFDLLVLVCSSPDFNGRVRADHSEAAFLTSRMRAEDMRLGEISQQDRNRLLGSAGRDLGCAVKTALALRAWTRLGDDAEAAEAVGVHEHEVEEARMEAVRLLQAMSALTDARDKAEQEAEGERVDLSEKIRALSAMVCAGLDDEAATLALIDGVGPVMARRLLSHGVTDIEALALADAQELAEMPGLSAKRAAAWIAAAETFVGEGGALRYREACGQQQESDGGSTVLRGLDYCRWERASKLTVTANASGWTVTGGSEPHQVSEKAQGQYVCDCGDAARGRLCKHVIAIRHLSGDPAVPRFDEGFPEAEGQGLDLAAEWGRGRKALA